MSVNHSIWSEFWAEVNEGGDFTYADKYTLLKKLRLMSASGTARGGFNNYVNRGGDPEALL